MHAVERERKHLAEANRHIPAAKRQIERQKRVVEKLAQAGHETDVAKSLLHAMERSLNAFEQHRELIVETMKTLESQEPSGLAFEIAHQPGPWLKRDRAKRQS